MVDVEGPARRSAGIPAVRRICETYASASALEAMGAHVIRVDEKTGIQALERLYATKPTRPGLIERREFE